MKFIVVTIIIFVAVAGIAIPLNFLEYLRSQQMASCFGIVTRADPTFLPLLSAQ